MSECDCANMKWEDQDGNELDAVVCRMCCNDIADLLDQKDLTIIDLESRVKDIESSWQDAELRADTNLKRVEELERELCRYRIASTYPRGDL